RLRKRSKRRSPKCVRISLFAASCATRSEDSRRTENREPRTELVLGSPSGHPDLGSWFYSMVEPKYHRILLKLSGEALTGTGGDSISPEVLEYNAQEIE